MPRLIGSLSVTLSLIVTVATLLAQETPTGGTAATAGSTVPDRQAVINLLKKMETSFSAGDAKGLASCWTENGEFIGPGGARMEGREMIEKQFQEAFAARKQGPYKLEFQPVHLRLASDHLALVEAVAEVTPAVVGGGAPLAAFVLVKQDGRWLIESARDTTAHLPAGENLKQLAWLVGNWASETSQNGVTLRTSCDWTANRAFLIRKFKVEGKQTFLQDGTEVIGWDPRSNRIRSWVFDSDGGFGENIWVLDGNHWLIKYSGTLADGSEASATHIFTKVDDNTATLQSKDRVVSGVAQPDVPETTLKRQVETKPAAEAQPPAKPDDPAKPVGKTAP